MNWDRAFKNVSKTSDFYALLLFKNGTKFDKLSSHKSIFFSKKNRTLALVCGLKREDGVSGKWTVAVPGS